MALLILSKEVPRVEDTLAYITSTAYNKGFKLSFDERQDSNRDSVDVYISKHYQDDEEYVYLGIESEVEVIDSYDLLNLEAKGNRFYRIAVTDQAEYDHLIYDFALAYLRLKPEHCISLYGETFFFLEDMEKLESEGGYYKDWCYTPAS